MSLCVIRSRSHTSASAGCSFNDVSSVQAFVVNFYTFRSPPPHSPLLLGALGTGAPYSRDIRWPPTSRVALPDYHVRDLVVNKTWGLISKS